MYRYLLSYLLLALVLLPPMMSSLSCGSDKELEAKRTAHLATESEAADDYAAQPETSTEDLHGVRVSASFISPTNFEREMYAMIYESDAEYRAFVGALDVEETRWQVPATASTLLFDWFRQPERYEVPPGGGGEPEPEVEPDAVAESESGLWRFELFDDTVSITRDETTTEELNRRVMAQQVVLGIPSEVPTPQLQREIARPGALHDAAMAVQEHQLAATNEGGDLNSNIFYDADKGQWLQPDKLDDYYTLANNISLAADFGPYAQASDAEKEMVHKIMAIEAPSFTPDVALEARFANELEQSVADYRGRANRLAPESVAEQQAMHKRVQERMATAGYAYDEDLASKALAYNFLVWQRAITDPEELRGMMGVEENVFEQVAEVAQVLAPESQEFGGSYARAYLTFQDAYGAGGAIVMASSCVSSRW